MRNACEFPIALTCFSGEFVQPESSAPAPTFAISRGSTYIDVVSLNRIAGSFNQRLSLEILQEAPP
jgi:hypothetical protein